MHFSLLQIVFAALAVFASADACNVRGKSQCPQNCGAGADNLCHLPGGYCECVPY
ncbi:hypothetical protein FKW77_003961 [Venturia effusa]|uniref:Invertebrate defensins family profile domain-containing protein n=1 Tax=Venturia effusa TaxID=50376 RepID=A0A517LPY3_9PEZI|nr:hypothetical protein FKW77_003961 [Venturia effusa]